MYLNTKIDSYIFGLLYLQLSTDVDDYVSAFRPDIMELVFAWSKGARFIDVMKLAEVFEGSLIRAMRRLEEVLQQLVVAAHSIGEADFKAKLEDGITKIKRDIVFAASLYL